MGSGSRDVDAWHANGSDAEDRGLQVPMALEHGPVTSSGKAAPGPDPRIRHRTQIGMFRPIRMDHTNCLQVAIKTSSSSKRTRTHHETRYTGARPPLLAADALSCRSGKPYLLRTGAGLRDWQDDHAEKDPEESQTGSGQVTYIYFFLFFFIYRLLHLLEFYFLSSNL